MIALFDTSRPLRPLRTQLDAAIARVVDSGRFILGPEVSAFEAELASWCGTRHAIGVANGTEALTIALRTIGVGPGDEVVVPSFTFYASAEAIPPSGARPVFCDVDPHTCCVTADTVKAALTPRTKAVIAVHVFGNVAPVADIAALGVPVIEDAALQAAVLRVLLPHVDAWADGRRAAAGHYEAAGLSEVVALPVAAPGSQPAWHLYVVRSERADELAAGLAAADVAARAYYRTPVHRQPAMAPFAAGAQLPATDELARTHLAIPMSPLLSAEQARQVCAAARRTLA